MDELVRDVTRFDPAGTAANRRVTEVVVQTDKLRIEILDRQPQIPHSAADVSIRRMRVVHGGRAVLLVQADETGDARLESFDLLREIR